MTPPMDPAAPGLDPGHPDDRLGRLSPAQLAVLALVADYKSSKEIARELGISPHTVDQRMKRVQSIMGVQSRFEAARVYAAVETPASPSAPSAWGDLMYQPSALVTDRYDDNHDLSGRAAPPDTRPLIVRQVQANYTEADEQAPWYATLLVSESANDLTPTARTMVIAALTLAAVLSLAAVVSVAEGLSRLF